jgi:dsRNA-specific ribonuclease
MEAIIGAIHEKEGYEKARTMVEALFLTEERLEKARNDPDPITKLKEMVEGRKWKAVHTEYERIYAEKTKFFHAIEIGDKRVVGTGPSRRNAELHATRCMLSLIEPHGQEDDDP